MDRRINRTRTAIFYALMDLLVEKESSRITVLELCQKADINKSTFYLHYKSLDECLQKCFKVIMNGVVELAKKINYYEMSVNPEPIINGLLDEVEKNIDYLARFKDSNICGPAVKVLKKKLVSSIMESNNFTPETNYTEYSVITFAVAGCFDALIEPLPSFNKPELSEAVCFMLKKNA
jgi:AcrR family transcriptional regulator